MASWQRIRRLLVFCPKPSCNRFSYIDERLFLVFTLAHTSRQCGTLSDDPTIFLGMQDYMEHHCKAPRQLKLPISKQSTGASRLIERSASNTSLHLATFKLLMP